MLFRSVGFQLRPEVQEGRGVGHALGAEVNAREALPRLAVVERVFEGFIGQPIPWLEEIDAQHQFQPNGWTPALALGIRRLDDGEQPRPWDDFLHESKELFAACGLLIGRKLGMGKGGLVELCRAVE